MAAKFTNIKIAEMEAFLKPLGFVPILGLEGAEKVYGVRKDHQGMQLTLRVFTGIVGQESREVGEDAIRVALFWRNPVNNKIRLISGSKRVHRVEGWRENLKKRIDAWQSMMPKTKCAKCGAPMVQRKGNNGPFLGCCNYPDCRHTERV